MKIFLKSLGIARRQGNFEKVSTAMRQMLRLHAGTPVKSLCILPIFILVLTGCTLTTAKISISPGAENWPRIHTIGSDTILNFQKGADLIIPIEGQNLFDENSVLSASIQAPTSLRYGVDYYLDKTNSGASSSLIFLVFKGNATANFNSKDHLLVNISATEKRSTNITVGTLPARLDKGLTEDQARDLELGKITTDVAFRLGAQSALERHDKAYKVEMETWLNGKDSNLKKSYDEGYEQSAAISGNTTSRSDYPFTERILSSDSRTFILFSPDDYRTQVLAHEIEIQNITAFPLPEGETKKLFGDFVGNTYYAVRLTLKNPSDQDQIVSLGMIKAYGRALVELAKLKDARYTRPIEIAPQSQQQVYTMVQNPKGAPFDIDSGELDFDSMRDWFFGELEFAGSMATAYGAAFNPSADYLKAVALATGTAIPGLGKFIPDKRSFYLLNVVNFAMPDLVKVPKGGSIDGKYLFFSKGRLQAMIQDPTFAYSISEGVFGDSFLTPKSQFAAQVVRLEFDTLQVPFENVTSVNGSNAISFAIEDLKNKANQTLQGIANIKANWTQYGNEIRGTLNTMTGDELSNILANAKSATELASQLTTNRYVNVNALLNDIKIFQTNANWLLPNSISSNLINSPSYGSEQLTAALFQLKTAEDGIIAGKPEQLYQSTVDSAKRIINPATDLVSFYEDTASLIQRNSPKSDLIAISSIKDPSKPLTDDDKKAMAKAFEDIDWLVNGINKPPIDLK